MSLRVGFIGLGLMGRPMVLRLLRAGYHLTVWNRTIHKADQIAEEGAHVAETPAELAKSSDVIVTMVTGPDAMHAVMGGRAGVLKGIRRGCTVIDMSTNGVRTTLQCAKQCEDVGAMFLDAPVTGSVPGAENGSLTVMVGGEREVFDEYRLLLQVFGQPIYVGKQGMGALVKLSQNLVAASIVESLAEGVKLATAHGLDVSKVEEVLTQTGVSSGFLRLKMEKMVAGDYSPQFSLANMTKDLLLVGESAEQANVHLPVAKELLRVYQGAVDEGLGSEDYAALVKALGEKDS